MSGRGIALGIVLAWSAPLAVAQWSPPATLDLGLGTARLDLSASMLSGERGAHSRDGLPAELRSRCAKRPADRACRLAAAAPELRRSLDFKPVAAVGQRVEREMIDELARRNRGLLKQKLEFDLRGTNLKRQFDLQLRLNGRSPTNLADVLSLYLILAWEGYAGAQASPTQVAAVSRQWRARLRGSVLAVRTDVQKQTLAETLAWRAMLAASVVRVAREQVAPQVPALREGLRKEVLNATGIDFARQPLGARGFE